MLASNIVEVHLFRRVGGRPLYLMLQRAPEASQVAGRWTMVSGAIRDGETTADAAIRITAEQTGFQVRTLWALDYLHTYYLAEDDCIHLTPVFTAEVTDSQVRLTEEFTTSRWITFDQALDLHLPGQREGLRRAHENVAIASDRGILYRVNLPG